MVSSNRAAPRTARFVVRTRIQFSNGMDQNRIHSSHRREDLALLACVDILRQWAAPNAVVQAGARVSVVDTSDGGVLFTMSYLGYDDNTLEDALDTFQRNGFTLQEVESGK